MNITWAGYACFKIEGSAITIITDPFDPSSGLKFSHKKADVVVSSCSNPYHGNVSAIKEKGKKIRIIATSGEYEIRDVFIYGIPVKIKNKGGSADLIIFRIEMDGITLVHLGALSEALHNSQLEHLEKTDILFIPVGGGNYMNAVTAQALISQIAPKIVIPMCYKIPGAKAQLDEIEKFYKEMGMKPSEILSKLKVSKKDIGTNGTNIKVLSIE